MVLSRLFSSQVTKLPSTSCTLLLEVEIKVNMGGGGLDGWNQGNMGGGEVSKLRWTWVQEDMTERGDPSSSRYCHSGGLYCPPLIPTGIRRNPVIPEDSGGYQFWLWCRPKLEVYRTGKRPLTGPDLNRLWSYFSSVFSDLKNERLVIFSPQLPLQM